MMSWMTGSWSIQVLVLGLSLTAAESGPLSSNGCACKSGCDKSWMSLVNRRGSGTEWCYVDKTCKAAGWDSCHDSQMLYESALDEKKKAVQQTFTEKLRREDAEKHEGELNTQVAGLRKQLRTELLKEATATNKFEEAERKADQKAAEADQKVAAAAQKTADAERKFKDMEQVEHHAEATINETEKKLAQVTSKEQETEKRLQAEERNFNEKLQEEERKFNDSSKVAKATEVHAKDTEVKQHEAERMQREAAIKQHEAVLKLSDSELREADMEKKMNKIKADAMMAKTMRDGALQAMAKFKATSEEQLAEANQKLANTEMKLHEETIFESGVTRRLKQVEGQQAEMKKQLEVAEKTRREAVAELKPFRLAVKRAVNSKIFGK